MHFQYVFMCTFSYSFMVPISKTIVFKFYLISCDFCISISVSSFPTDARAKANYDILFSEGLVSRTCSFFFNTVTIGFPMGPCCLCLVTPFCWVSMLSGILDVFFGSGGLVIFCYCTHWIIVWPLRGLLRGLSHGHRWVSKEFSKAPETRKFSSCSLSISMSFQILGSHCCSVVELFLLLLLYNLQ